MIMIITIIKIIISNISTHFLGNGYMYMYTQYLWTYALITKFKFNKYI